jgi:type IV pilus assembly protein PilW
LETLATTGGNTTWATTIYADDTDTNGDAVINNLDGPYFKHIRAIKIWILARSNRQDSKHNNTNTYTVGSQVITPNDKFYRRLLTTTVTCRNMGL